MRGKKLIVLLFVLVFAVAFIRLPEVKASTVVREYARSFTDISGSGWSNEANCLNGTSDNSCAVGNKILPSNGLRLYNFSFNLPEGVTIESIVWAFDSVSFNAYGDYSVFFNAWLVRADLWSEVCVGYYASGIQSCSDTIWKNATLGVIGLGLYNSTILNDNTGTLWYVDIYASSYTIAVGNFGYVDALWVEVTYSEAAGEEYTEEFSETIGQSADLETFRELSRSFSVTFNGSATVYTWREGSQVFQTTIEQSVSIQTWREMFNVFSEVLTPSSNVSFLRELAETIMEFTVSQSLSSTLMVAVEIVAGTAFSRFGFVLSVLALGFTAPSIAKTKGEPLPLIACCFAVTTLVLSIAGYPHLSIVAFVLSVLTLGSSFREGEKKPSEEP